MSESKHVWVFLETEDGQLRSVGLELLGQGRLLADKMGEQLVGVILDPHAGTLAAQAIEQGLVYPIAVRESIPDRAVCLIEDASHPQSIAIRAFKKLLCAEKPEAETPPAATRPG